MVSTDRRYAQTNHNEAIFDKWENKFVELRDAPFFNEKKHAKESQFHLQSLHKIKELITVLMS